MKVDLPTDENDSETNVRSVIAAINYVNDLNIKIINMSGNSIIGPTGFDVSATFRTAVESYQGLIICSAGNSGKYLMTEEEDNDSYHNDIYPAALICDNLITVGSSNMDDEKSSFSNWGVHNVDLFAPGEYILSCFPISKCVGNTCEIDEGYQYSHVVDGYHSLSGTSMAAPFVTGVAALLLTINPELSANELRDYILDNVDEVDALQGLCVTGGRLNALKAVTALVNNCNHTLTYSHSIEGHTSTCITCGYTKTFRNAFYVVLQTSLSITVKCSVCSTQLPACSHNLQYSPIAKEYHRAFCNVCNFGFREDHNALYEDSESNTWHDMTCTTCNYSGIEEHDWHVVEFDEDEQIYIECDQCLRTTVCEHGNYNSIDSVKHTIDCRECDILFTEDHTLLTQKVTNSLHRVYCSGCSYSQAEVHTYYEISWDETEVEVGCRKCELKISCTHQPDEEINAYTHGESCSSCGYVIAEAHTFIYTSVNNAIYHNVNCRICGYSGTEAHTWESNNGVSECPLCGQTNSSPVTPVLSLPPEDEEELTE